MSASSQQSVLFDDKGATPLATALLKQLCVTPGAYAGIAVPAPEVPGRLQTLVFCDAAQRRSNLTFSLGANHSAPALQAGRSWVPAGLQHAAADNHALAELGIDACATVPLVLGPGYPDACLLLFSTTPLADAAQTFALLDAEAGLLALAWQQQEALLVSRREQTLLQALLDAVPYPIFYKNHESRYMGCNSATELVLGYSRAQLLGKTLREVVPTKLVTACNLTEERILSGKVREDSHEGKLCLPGGETREYLFHKAPVIADGQIAGVACSFLDITERVRAYARLDENRKFLQAIIDSVVDPIMVVGLAQDLLLLNSAARKFSPRLANQEQPLRCSDVCRAIDSPCREGGELCPVQEVLRSQQPVKLLQKQRLVTGEQVLFEVVAVPFLDDQGVLRGVIHWARDISERDTMLSKLDEKEERLRFLAFHDPLTHLPNRILFHERLQHAMARCQRKETLCAMLFVDLDRFKVINDSLGHDIGDQVLVEIARFLKAGVRETDTVARFGGDEFLLLLEGSDGQDQILPVVRTLMRLFEKPICVSGMQLYVTASIGICLYPNDANDAESMVKNAEVAMYRGKANGRNTYAFYDRTMGCRAHDQLTRELALRQAMERGELQLYYQPQVELDTHRVIGFEALMRWQHPLRGVIGPDEFIPLAEETGLIIPLGEWCVDQACCFIKRQQSHAPTLEVVVAVNVAPRQFREPGFVAMIAETLKRHDLKACLLELEITEGAIMENVPRSIECMAALERMGVRIAIDDFGTGYSSLSYLKKFPVTTLKIDRSFIVNLTSDKGDAAIVSAIIALADKMGLRTLAEGVETEEQLVALQRFGCDSAQGFFFSPAIPEAAALLFSARKES